MVRLPEAYRDRLLQFGRGYEPRRTGRTRGTPRGNGWLQFGRGYEPRRTSVTSW